MPYALCPMRLKGGMMTENLKVEAAWTYHNGTKHSYQSVRSSRHSLDFSNQPTPFKIYKTLEPIPLPRELQAIPMLLYLSAGITRERHVGDWEYQFRAAACTGALYHIELYLACGDLPGLPAGFYHFGVHDFALRLLRQGDYRPILVQATGAEPSVAAAPAALVCTSTYWRNAWKYQARAYRHSFWDSGTILANLLAAAAGLGVPARIVLGFADAAVNHLLDVESDREASLAVVPLGRTTTPPSGDAPAAPPLHLETAPLSRFEVDYPAIRAMHAASSLTSGGEAARWRGAGPSGDPPPARGGTVPLRPLGDTDVPPDSVTEVIQRRGSTRSFSRKPLTLADRKSTRLNSS